ncbi:deoxycytidine deaminase [Nostoc sp. PCC 7524]|uniref:dCTP deaminase n=1 Tax=Nostoc sp. (strain ATCC 29411 / PCC 7524) TaxID=28072 RepID=UPI00029F37B9|nr:deoxycytidine deaminase [Nostoc sp. PCC 7524]AFY46386.1 deoxycytidine deaminase [Nostoc sp. PCC 7524]
MLSDTDIKQQIEERKNNSAKGILIDPFEEKYLTPVGYDLRVGTKGFSWKKKCEIDIEKERGIEIEPNDTVIIETLESVSLSKEVGATIHAMVSKAVLYGLSHISTTIDPGWTGKLLISVSNYRDSSVMLRFRDSFCTVCFYQMESESIATLGRPVDRDDIWERLLEIAKEERDRQIKEIQIKKGKEKAEDRIRIGLMVAFILLASFIGLQISFKDAALGASLAAFLAVVSPSIIELLKPK